MSVRADSAKTQSFLSTLPPWATTLTGLILLALMVLAIFTWQQSITRKNLQKNSSSRSRMVAGIIEQNISNSHASKETVDTLVSAFLLEKAKFVEYLDNIDRLTVQELEALAVETGLLGISIAREDGTTVSGPQLWLDPTPCIGPFNTVLYNLDRKSGILRYLGGNTLGLCISIGLDAQQILALQNKTALPVLLSNLSNLPGIHYVRLEESRVNKKIEGKVVLIPRSGTITAESRIKTKNGTLVVGLDATNFLQRRDQLRKQFIVFAVLLFTLALLFSWILFKRQQAELERTRNFERMLASERETAALGRATATIAHEIRNPLNAINMGLQRLVLESDNLRDEQDQLIEAMREAVTRTSNIIGGLQRFTANLIPKQNVVDVANLIRQQLALYTPI
ncbi:MAG: hypothetical protein GY702_02505, partial [Desulfobulbaceae bacterium]|nr:hypothetical protein [Desulfobulbaceae bacterium]